MTVEKQMSNQYVAQINANVDTPGTSSIYLKWLRVFEKIKINTQ
uniref:Uncharacterized protein n=1 Tax=Anguilla anguilla TaxID=7936 RepID=A0A0E9VBB2_ANGAN